MMSQPRALITGICGQDGAYLCQLLIAKGYKVAGLDLEGGQVLTPPGCDDISGEIEFIGGSVADREFVERTIVHFAPTEIYHLAGRSHVGQSFESPADVVEINSVGTMNVLNAIGAFEVNARPRIMLASSCEIFGPGDGNPMREDTPLNPQSPYALSKELALKASHQARELYDLHLSNGIFFNHESPLRSPDYVTAKICASVAAIEADQQSELVLGNLDARRDWGHAADFVDGMWRMLQQPSGDDYVLATGEARSVREFVELAFDHIGKALEWRGQGVDEVGVEPKSGDVLVRVDAALFRLNEIPARTGDASKARKALGWEPKISFPDLVAEMVQEDRRRVMETKIALGG